MIQLFGSIPRRGNGNEHKKRIAQSDKRKPHKQQASKSKSSNTSPNESSSDNDHNENGINSPQSSSSSKHSETNDANYNPITPWTRLPQSKKLACAFAIVVVRRRWGSGCYSTLGERPNPP